MSKYWRVVLALALLGTAVDASDLGAQRRAEVERRGWLGFSYTATDSAGGQWMEVERVVPGSPAEEAGIAPGDRIVRWNGRADAVGAATAARLEAGDTVRLRVRREGARDRDVVVVAEPRSDRIVEFRRNGRDGDVVVIDPRGVIERFRLHADSLVLHADSLHQRLRLMLRDSLGPRLRELERMELPRIHIEMDDSGHARANLGPGGYAFDFHLGARAVAGAEFAEVNAGLSEYFGTDHGALVLRVAPETPAARAGLRAGDVVVSANGTEVDEVSDLRSVVARDRDRAVELEVVRRGERRRVRLNWE